MSAVLTSGAAMDRRVPVPTRRWIAVLAVAAVAVAAGLLDYGWPRGVPVPRADVEIARAKTGPFRDVVVGRATAQPLQSVLLDATEDGRVEQVLVKDGERVEAGQLLVVLNSTTCTPDPQYPSTPWQPLVRTSSFAAPLASIGGGPSSRRPSSSPTSRRCAPRGCRPRRRSAAR